MFGLENLLNAFVGGGASQLDPLQPQAPAGGQMVENQFAQGAAPMGGGGGLQIEVGPEQYFGDGGQTNREAYARSVQQQQMLSRVSKAEQADRIRIGDYLAKQEGISQQQQQEIWQQHQQQYAARGVAVTTPPPPVLASFAAQEQDPLIKAAKQQEGLKSFFGDDWDDNMGAFIDPKASIKDNAASIKSMMDAKSSMMKAKQPQEASLQKEKDQEFKRLKGLLDSEIKAKGIKPETAFEQEVALYKKVYGGGESTTASPTQKAGDTGLPKYSDPASARQAVKDGKLAPGAQFIDGAGITRTVKPIGPTAPAAKPKAEPQASTTQKAAPIDSHLTEFRLAQENEARKQAQNQAIRLGNPNALDG